MSPVAARLLLPLPPPFASSRCLLPLPPPFASSLCQGVPVHFVVAEPDYDYGAASAEVGAVLDNLADLPTVTNVRDVAAPPPRVVVPSVARARVW